MPERQTLASLNISPGCFNPTPFPRISICLLDEPHMHDRLHLSIHYMLCNLEGLVVLALAGTDSLLGAYGPNLEDQYSKNPMVQS